MRTARTPLTGVARTLRGNSTDAERILWAQLRDRRLAGCKFRRQFPIERYVVDFVCLERRLIVELDGGQHADESAYEEARAAALLASEFRLLRFWNNEVLNELDGVLSVILGELARGPSP